MRWSGSHRRERCSVQQAWLELSLPSCHESPVWAIPVWASLYQFMVINTLWTLHPPGRRMTLLSGMKRRLCTLFEDSNNCHMTLLQHEGCDDSTWGWKVVDEPCAQFQDGCYCSSLGRLSGGHFCSFKMGGQVKRTQGLELESSCGLTVREQLAKASAISRAQEIPHYEEQVNRMTKAQLVWSCARLWASCNSCYSYNHLRGQRGIHEVGKGLTVSLVGLHPWASLLYRLPQSLYGRASYAFEQARLSRLGPTSF